MSKINHEEYEVWRDIKGYEGIYQVSDLGKVKSLARTIYFPSGGKRKVKDRILKPAIDKDGYELLTLAKNGENKNTRVHRIVAEAFIPNNENKPQVNHINEIKDDNRAVNLEWSTSQENINHGNGIEKRAKKARKPVMAINILTKERKVYPSIISTEKDGFCSRTVSSVCKGREGRTQHRGYFWKYISEKKFKQEKMKINRH